MKFLFIFLDGVGLGPDDPASNPFARAEMPALQAALGGRKLLAGAAPYVGERLSLLALDPNLGVAGLPQSASGQAALLTGRNVPAELGYHYGPKPNPEIAAILRQDNLFCRLRAAGLRVTSLNAYPQRYFDGITSGLRLYSAIPLALTSAGVALRSAEDLYAGQAVSADLTAQGWRQHLGYADTPLLSPEQAGEQMARLTQPADLAFFEYWLTDYAGHGQDMNVALEILAALDGMLAGMLAGWDDTGLALITSDHGNLEDLSTRRHTANPVPALLLGERSLRREFAADLTELTGITPRILKTFNLDI